MKNFVAIHATGGQPFRVTPVEATCLEEAFRAAGGPSKDFCTVLSEIDTVRLVVDLLGAVSLAGWEQGAVLDLLHKMQKNKGVL